MQIHFVGYAGDCRVSGLLDLTRERMTETLNGMDVIPLHGVVLESLDDGRRVAIDELELSRDELYAVEARGPSGTRRIHTVRQRIQVQLGPYTVLGELHVRPGADPLASVVRRPAMVPLTRATIAYVSGGQLQMHDAGTLLVNRCLADWVEAAEEHADFFPGVPMVPAPASRGG